MSTPTELLIWSDNDVGELLVKLANTTGDEYDKVREEWDERSIQFAYGLLAAVRQHKSEISILREFSDD